MPNTNPFAGKKSSLWRYLRTAGWFLFGGLLGLFFFVSFVFIYFKLTYANVVYPGIYVDSIDFGGKSKDEVRTYFAKKNQPLAHTIFTFRNDDMVATVSANRFNAGYDANLLSEQAFMLGRSDNTISNISIIFQAYMHGVSLDPSYRYSDEAYTRMIQPFKKAINVDPVDAQFNFQNGRVIAFKPSSNGEKVDEDKLKKAIQTKTYVVLQSQKPDRIAIDIPVITVEPKVTTEKANNLGVNELIGTGTSLFHGSIANRIYNLTLASSKLNGVLVAPGEIFSFAKVVGDISKYTGYKEAYVIQNGKTVLGDGGGVCQVSTTLFRAVLNAGLPIIERHQHAYRVHYYEEDLGPGIDAAVYVPSVDFKFKNDTGHYLLIQTTVDPDNEKLTYEIYGTSDGRVSHISEPVIVSQSPAPDPVYQDDPTLPKGQIKQVDFAASGAVVYFNWTVTRNGKTIESEKFTSNYRPWQAIYLRGTKEG